MKPSRVLVTGSEGFMGSHLVERLVREGYNVRALVFYNSFGSIGWLGSIPKDILAQVDVVHGDLRDLERIHECIKGCDYVVHLGALIAIPYSFQAPRSYIDTNISGTLNVLNACLAHGVRKLIHTSTSEVYGSAQYTPMDEKHPISPQSPYAASKAGADSLVNSFIHSYQLNATILRPFNTFGPRQSLRAIIPTVITQVLEDGSRVNLGNTAAIRDFTFVSDTVEGFVLALRNDSVLGLTLNLGTGAEWQIRDVVKLICEISGSEADIREDQERVRPHSSEVNRLISDNSLAKEALGWNPKFVDRQGFKEGLVETLNWFRENMESQGINASKYHV